MKNIYFPILALLILFSSCNESELYQLPRGQQLLEDYYANEEEAMFAINSAYQQLTMYDGWHAFWGDYGTDDVHKGGWGVSDNGQSSLEKQGYIYDGNSQAVTSYWNNCYRGIYKCNLILENVPETVMDEDLKKRIIGEATFLRAFYHMTLAKYYGEAPLVDRVLTPEEFNQPKVESSVLWQFVEDEFNAAAKLLPKRSEYPKTDMGRADKGACIGLNCKAAWYRGDMAKVKSYAEQLFALNEYSLESDYYDVWTNLGEWGPGSIFEVTYFYSGQAGWGAGLGSMISRPMRTRNEKGGGDLTVNGWGFHLPTRDLYESFEDGDPRRSISMHTIDDTLAQNYNPIDWPEMFPNSLWNRKYASAPFNIGYIIETGASGENEHHNYRLLRLADIYLLYSEAIAQENPTLAQDYLNRVRKRARESSIVDDMYQRQTNPDPNVLPNIIASGTALLDAIYRERRVELCLEGHRMYDIIHQGKTQIIKNLYPAFEDGKHYTMPIPTDEIIKSQGVLVNNEYWGGSEVIAE